ncbi:hypothetical protein GOODEAATRI_013685, partial [Goodea atripinnis]
FGAIVQGSLFGLVGLLPQKYSAVFMSGQGLAGTFAAVRVMAFCVTFVFTVTLSVFPAITVDVKTSFPGKWERYFISVCCFLVFNIFDWLGRSITSVIQWDGLPAWGIGEEKVVCITSDNGANIVAAVRDLKWPRIT